MEELVRDRAQHAPDLPLDRSPLRRRRCCCGAPCRRRRPRARSRRGTCRCRSRTREARRKSPPARARSSRSPPKYCPRPRRSRRGGPPHDRELPAVRVADLERSDDCSLSSVGLSIRYWRFGAVNVQGSGVGKSCVAGVQPSPAGGRERDADRPRFEAARPHQRRRHVHVRVGRVDAEIGAVHAVAEHLVDHADGAVVPGDVPLIGVRPDDCSALPAPSNACTSKTFFANSWTA